jgi:hypothetical protein
MFHLGTERPELECHCIVGLGTIKWTIRDVFGCTRAITTEAYYVPKASIRLLSPQTYFQEKLDGELHMNAHRTRLTLHDGSRLEFPFSCGGNLPIMLTAKHFKQQTHLAGLSFEDAQMLGSLGGLLSVADENNQNLTAPQRELLLWHQRINGLATSECNSVKPYFAPHHQIPSNDKFFSPSTNLRPSVRSPNVLRANSENKLAKALAMLIDSIRNKIS